MWKSVRKGEKDRVSEHKKDWGKPHKVFGVTAPICI